MEKGRRTRTPFELTVDSGARTHSEHHRVCTGHPRYRLSSTVSGVTLNRVRGNPQPCRFRDPGGPRRHSTFPLTREPAATSQLPPAEPSRGREDGPPLSGSCPHRAQKPPPSVLHGHDSDLKSGKSRRLFSVGVLPPPRPNSPHSFTPVTTLTSKSRKWK